MENAEKLGEFELTKLSSAIDEYKKRIDQIVQEERLKWRQMAEEEAEKVIDQAMRRAEVIVAENQQRCKQIEAEAEQKARKEEARIIDEAKRKAGEIIKEAVEEATKEAGEATRIETERVLERARAESDDIIARAKWSAEKEMEQFTKDAVVQAMARASHEANQIIAEAHEKTKIIVDDAVGRSKKTTQMLMDIVQGARGITDQFQQDMQAKLEESSTVVASAADDLRQVLESPVETTAAKTEVIEPYIEVFTNSPKNGSRGPLLYQGYLEIKTGGHCTIEQVKNFTASLTGVSGIKLIGECGSGSGLTVLFNVLEPTTLISVFMKMPVIERVVADGNIIRLFLKRRANGTEKIAAKVSNDGGER
jgi:vacuolar-type H+-ATPase subunit H